MKKILLFTSLFLLALTSYSQIMPYYPIQSKGNLIQYNYFRHIRSSWIPTFAGSTPSLNGTVDSVGNGLSYTVADGMLNISKGLGTGFNKFPNLAYVTTQLATKQAAFTSETASKFYASPTTTSGVPSFRVFSRIDAYPIFGASTTSGTLDWNDITNTKPGFGSVLLAGTATNGNGSASLFYPLNIEYGAAKDGSGNITQFAIPYSPISTDGITHRSRNSGAWSSWRKIYDSSNLTISSYALLASPTFTGTPTLPTGTIAVTQSAITNNTTVATTAYVTSAVLATSIVNTTTTALSSATLNSTYPSVMVGYRVICHLITGAPAIYTKATENGSSDVWLTTSVTTTP